MLYIVGESQSTPDSKFLLFFFIFDVKKLKNTFWITDKQAC